ncbi:hypothetical protein GCK72_021516 [Caenorhabditis remanei]|uniref:CUB-like domain-containing protein n=1 Tax=Caenorhabditis remanei TaxID=31234 RepID=A0A6A5GK22_CAERE|nr:hypothetical protein GCK72_021516 [Caenorhabditis remanei]KAF1754951.1 hypothetical protein GCK72_021516 [Caenorhabditis remanei]
MLLILFLLTITGCSALNCVQIQPAQIYNGNIVYIPGGNGSLQLLPANYNCTYRILPPVNYNTGLYAKVKLKNGLRGANDFIIVTDVDGKATTMNNRTGIGGLPFKYLVFPGAQFFIQVTTKSVLMNSLFSITVEYHNAPIGPTSQLKTGSEMNYFEMATVRDGRNVFSSRTFTDKDSIYMYVGRKDNGVITCWDCFLIDGTFMNQTRVFRLDTCNAYVVDGPPNNSSKVIMDISNATMPKSFDLKYFSVINLDCDFKFGVNSYDN